jgi:hypothetical protein
MRDVAKNENKPQRFFAWRDFECHFVQIILKNCAILAVV